MHLYHDGHVFGALSEHLRIEKFLYNIIVDFVCYVTLVNNISIFYYNNFIIIFTRTKIY